jgi:Cu-Zn family superoxide dismutase
MGDEMSRVAAVAFALLSVATAIGGCAGGAGVKTGATVAGGGASISPDVANPATVMARGTFVPATPAPPSGIIGYTYDTALVPTGSGAELMLTPESGKTDVRLAVTGLLPQRGYGAHLHGKACGPDPATAGGHYQHNPDPSAAQSPSVDPGYANPTNEIWLDFTTDKSGHATSRAEVPWVSAAERRPNSLVIHAYPTVTEPGKAGTAGPRVACLTIRY